MPDELDETSDKVKWGTFVASLVEPSDNSEEESAHFTASLTTTDA